VNNDISREREINATTAAPEDLENGTRNLALAAESAARAGVDLQHFMAAAYGAYLEANPALRQQLESERLLEELEELRRRGRLGQA
jgi:hypothetical protein